MVQQNVSERTSDEIKVEAKQLKLGTNSNILSVIGANGNADNDINMKISKIAATFKNINKIWPSTTISTRLKIRLHH